MKSLNESLEEIIDPRQVVTWFDSMHDFRKWLGQAELLNDLRDCLKAFEKAELYEHCRVIQDAIDDYLDYLFVIEEE